MKDWLVPPVLFSVFPILSMVAYALPRVPS